MRKLLPAFALLLAVPVHAAQAYISIGKVERAPVIDGDFGFERRDHDVDRQRPAGGPGSISIAIRTDKASSYLYRECSRGSRFDEVKIDLCRTGEDCERVRYYDVVIDEIRISAGDDGPPTERLDLSYAKVKWEYVKIDSKGLAKRKRK